MWQDLWPSGQTKTVTVYHVTGHLPLASPRNDEVDTLAQVHWLEGKPVTDVPNGYIMFVACGAKDNTGCSPSVGLAIDL